MIAGAVDAARKLIILHSALPNHMCPKKCCSKLEFVGQQARVSERSLKARETGDITIARRWSAPGVSMVRVTPRKEKNKE